MRVGISLIFLAFVILSATGQERIPHSRLFPPEDIGILEGPDRDAWQRPDEVMDALGITEGATVADLGAGGGLSLIHI